MTRFAFIALVLIAANFLPVSDSAAQLRRPDTGSAQSAADQWKDLVDAGTWDQAWDSAGPAFKSMITREYWRGLMAGRAVHGHVMATRLQGSSPVALPGFPDGQYWVFQYQVEFRNGSTGSDMVAVRLEAGRWRIASYSFVPMTIGRAGVRPLTER